MVTRVTKNRTKTFVLCLFVAILSLSLYNCGGTFKSFPGEGDASGNWNLFLTPTGKSTVGPTVLSLTQTGNDLTGTTAGGGKVTGNTVSQHSNITLTITNTDGTTTTLTGNMSPDWKSMSGTYTSTGSDGSGTWDALKILPTPTPTPTGTPTSGLTVTPKLFTLSCSGTTGLQQKPFTVTGGTPPYAVVQLTDQAAALIQVVTTNLNATGEFTVLANACSGSTGSTTVTVNVTDSAQGQVSVPVTITNP